MVDMPANRESIPLFFQFRDRVEGDGFIANVISRGRILSVQEEKDVVWMYGVQPGGMDGGGESLIGAFVNFRTTYRGILYDILNDSRNLPDFRKKVNEFIWDICWQVEKEWLEAVKDVKRGKIKVKGLPKWDSKLSVYASVNEIKKPKQKHNVLAPERALAA